MRRSHGRHAGVLTVLALLSGNGYAQGTVAPSAELKAVFSPANKTRLCNSDDRVRATVLLGELGKAYQINLFALPDIPMGQDRKQPPILPRDGIGLTYAGPIEERASYWIVATGKIGLDVAKKFGIGAEHARLRDLQLDLSAYAHYLSQQDSGPYRLAPGVTLGKFEDLEARARLAEMMLNPPSRPGAEPTAAILCVDDLKPEQPKPTDPKKPPSDGPNGLVFAVRGTIDELAVPRNGRSDAFKKTTDAKVAYTMNGAKGEESVAANVVVGAGWTFGNHDALFGFARYTESSTETDAAGDDDDAKDVRAVSAGFLYRHPFLRGRLAAHTGVTAYKTWDRAQDSQLVRVRAFAEDIAIEVPGGPILCGSQSGIGALYFSCRMSVFAEKGRVVEAGRSLDFADTTDDDYAGAGGEIGLSFWLSGVKPLSKLMLTAQYKKMWVLDGDLDNPDRFMVELSYKLPNSDVSFGLSRTYGENFDTFQKEEVNLWSVGFKF